MDDSNDVTGRVSWVLRNNFRDLINARSLEEKSAHTAHEREIGDSWWQCIDIKVSWGKRSWGRRETITPQLDKKTNVRSSVNPTPSDCHGH